MTSSFFGSFPGPFHLVAGEDLPLIVGGLLAVWVMLVASAVLLRRSFKGIAQKLGVTTFDAAGLFFLIGATTVIVGIGIVLLIVAGILLSASFFSIRDDQQKMEMRQQTNSSSILPSSRTTN
jgi:uncharacterized membrane protein